MKLRQGTGTNRCRKRTCSADRPRMLTSYSGHVYPPLETQAEFCAAGALLKLAGGRGTAWRVGDLTLKPLDALPEGMLWLAEVAREYSIGSGLRLSLPIRSRSGKPIVDGWTASPTLLGNISPADGWSWKMASDLAAVFAEVERSAGDVGEAPTADGETSS